ncbi:uncharacterized protein PSFLO_05899 [Pseudozyma flocculosa]|uniref:Uncharacterized protein n=1 Tax=Pseudozyma flocculosa TaxID=84751 RepID=A0A5C3F9K0_9BASI|nr:uncharacterized protein PSFLO_05899 [Pseudozyma flocculosa]
MKFLTLLAIAVTLSSVAHAYSPSHEMEIRDATHWKEAPKGRYPGCGDQQCRIPEPDPRRLKPPYGRPPANGNSPHGLAARGSDGLGTKVARDLPGKVKEGPSGNYSTGIPRPGPPRDRPPAESIISPLALAERGSDELETKVARGLAGTVKGGSGSDYDSGVRIGPGPRDPPFRPPAKGI